MIRARYAAEIAKALEQWAAELPRWGRTDCAMALGNIDKRAAGYDSARGWRGRYYTQATAMRLMGKGGILRMAVAVARRWRWVAIDKKRLMLARDGDRAIAATPDGLACVIRYRGFWVGRHHGPGNVLAADSQILRAWSVC